jgi:hypothetical protein
MRLFTSVRISPASGFWTNGMGTRDTMGINFMWCNKTIGMMLCAVATGTASAAPIACPARMNDVGSWHILVNASLYDGPPDQMADLIPVAVGSVDRWSLDHVDPYLVCRYEGTAKTVTLHAQTVRICEAGKTPFQAYCK